MYILLKYMIGTLILPVSACCHISLSLAMKIAIIGRIGERIVGDQL